MQSFIKTVTIDVREDELKEAVNYSKIKKKFSR